MHDGVLASAQWFIDNVKEDLSRLVRLHNKPNLVLCGHSLGGAVITVLAMALYDHAADFRRSDGSTVNLKAYSFAPPPVVSLNLARKYKYLIDSFVVEDDIVCRLSYGHAMDLRQMLVAAMETTRQPSVWQRMWGSVRANVCCCWCLMVLYGWRVTFLFEHDYLLQASHRATGLFSNVPLNHLARCRESLRDQRDPRHTNIKLYLAGTVYFMYYEHAEDRPFASLVPAYDDLDVQKLRTSPTSAGVRDAATTAPRAPVSATTNFSSAVTGEAPGKPPSTARSVEGIVAPTIANSQSTTRSLLSLRSLRNPATPKPLPKRKRVIMERSDPANFGEMILKVGICGGLRT